MTIAKVLTVSILGFAGFSLAFGLADGQALSVAASKASVCLGQTVTLTASGSGASATVWSVSAGSANLNSNSGSQVKVGAAAVGTIRVHAQSGSDGSDTSVTARDCSAPDFLNGEVVRALLGFEQVGASGTSSSQNWLFDFYITRPALGPYVRWWGNVKVASFPQQVNTQLVTFGQQFASTFGSLKVNQLAQSAQFVTGPEFVVSSRDPFFLTLFVGGGANGPNNPTDNVTVFQVPATTSPQYGTFVKQFGTPPAGGNYVAFLPQSTNRFLRQWQAGVRLYTSKSKNANLAGVLPASVEYSIGQDEYVTSSRLSGLVGKVAATYPFTFGDPSSGKSVTIYLFGEATTAYKQSNFASPLPLAPALDGSQSPIAVTNPDTYTITVPANRRDTYRIGVGLDLLSVLNSLWGQKPPAVAANGK